MKRFIPLLVILALATGCAITAPGYAPDYSALDSLKRQKVARIAVDPAGPSDPGDSVNHISLRGSPLVSPSGTYSRYLEDAIKSDLKDANLLDQESLLRLSIFLLKNDINVAGFITGYGTIEANFNVKRNGTKVYDKNVAAETQFESSFMGAMAIPNGQIAYPDLVRALLRKLYTDKEFINAIKN